MSERTLDLRGGATHFLRTSGPRGFLLKFALAYAVISLIVQVISLWSQAPLYEIYVRVFAENDGDMTPYIDEINALSGRANLMSLAMLPVALGMWVMFEAASQRRYIRAEGFRLALGADEGRLAVVGLIWFALLIGAYIGLAIVALVPGAIAGLIAGPEVGIVVGGLFLVFGMIAGLWIYARLSPASALTIRDRQIRFFEGWELTKGHGWQLFGSYLLLFLGFMVISLIAYGVLIFIAIALLAPVLGAGGGSVSADAVIAAMSQPGFWAPMAALMFPVLMMGSVFAHAVGGPAALAVGQSSEAGAAAINETFS
jgi:hypothetical protein